MLYFVFLFLKPSIKKQMFFDGPKYSKSCPLDSSGVSDSYYAALSLVYHKAPPFTGADNGPLPSHPPLNFHFPSIMHQKQQQLSWRFFFSSCVISCNFPTKLLSPPRRRRRRNGNTRTAACWDLCNNTCLIRNPHLLLLLFHSPGRCSLGKQNP